MPKRRTSRQRAASRRNVLQATAASARKRKMMNTLTGGRYEGRANGGSRVPVGKAGRTGSHRGTNNVNRSGIGPVSDKAAIGGATARHRKAPTSQFKVQTPNVETRRTNHKPVGRHDKQPVSLKRIYATRGAHLTKGDHKFVARENRRRNVRLYLGNYAGSVYDRMVG